MAVEGKYQLSYTAAQIDDAIGKVVSGGTIGKDGKSAYEVAVANGFVGTEAQWLASLKGKNGTDGKDGAPGKNGAQGAKGDMIYGFEIGEGGVLYVVYDDASAVPPLVLDGDTLILDTALIGG